MNACMAYPPSLPFPWYSHDRRSCSWGKRRSRCSREPCSSTGEHHFTAVPLHCTNSRLSGLSPQALAAWCAPPPPSPHPSSLHARKQLEVGSPLAKLSTAGRSGLAITIRAQQPGPQRVPLLGSSQVQLCLRAPPPAGLGSETGEGSSGQLHRGDDGGRVSSHAAASSSSAGASGAGRGGRAAVSSENFTLHLPGDLGAPLALQVPHDWERVRRSMGARQHRVSWSA